MDTVILLKIHDNIISGHRCTTEGTGGLPMKYTKEERMEIVRHMYDGEITTAAATVKYELNPSSVKGHF